MSAAFPRRVLVVDDDRDTAEIIAEMLEAAGFSTLCAFDPASALDEAIAFAPHVALLDLGLPEMSGLELGRRLRELQGLASLKLVAVTGYGQKTDRDRTRAAGFDEHLVKPVQLAQVEALLVALFKEENG